MAEESSSEKRGKNPSEGAPPPEEAHVQHPTRWLWVFVGAVLMGSIALGAVHLARYTVIVSGIENTHVQFWVFEFGTGLGYLIGGFAVAVLSPGQTIREPMYAAMLAFVAQTLLLLATEIIVHIPPQAFLLMLAIDGAMAYLGAWLGEKVTGAA